MHDFILGDILCFIGASVRYAADRLFNIRKQSLKSYTNYKAHTETQFVDALLGAGIIAIILFTILEVIG